MKKQAIGLSPFLASDSTGHYATLHQALQNAFQDLGWSNSYLGQAKTENPSWSKALIPSAFKNPRRLLPIISMLLFARSLRKMLAGNSLLFCYETSFALGWSIAWACRGMKTMMILNLNQADFYAKLLNNRMSTRAVRGFLTNLMRVSTGLRIHVESKRLVSLFARKIPQIDIYHFPLPSTLSLANHEGRSKEFQEYKFILVQFSGVIQINLAMSVIDSALAKAETVHCFDIWIGRENRDILSQTYGSKLVWLPGRSLSEIEYQTVLQEAKEVWFVYLTEFHQWGSSGKLLDSCLMQKRVLVKSESALEDMARLYAHDWYSFEVVEGSFLPEAPAKRHSTLGVIRPIPTPTDTVKYMQNQLVRAENHSDASHAKLTPLLIACVWLAILALTMLPEKLIELIRRAHRAIQRVTR